MSKEKPTPEAPEKGKTPKKETPKEVGGFENKLEPTRYGDWDVNGRCSDF